MPTVFRKIHHNCSGLSSVLNLGGKTTRSPFFRNWPVGGGFLQKCGNCSKFQNLSWSDSWTNRGHTPPVWWSSDRPPVRNVVIFTAVWSLQSPVPSLSPYTHLSLKREVAQHLHLTYTVRQAWWCRATLCLSHPWDRALGQPVRQASALVHEGGTCHLVKKEGHWRKDRWTDLYLASETADRCCFGRLCLYLSNHVCNVICNSARNGTDTEIMPLHLPGGSTLQWGVGWGLLCMLTLV